MLHWQIKKGMKQNPLLFSTQMCLPSHSKSGSTSPKAALSLPLARLVGRKVGMDATTKHIFLINKNPNIQRITISFAKLTK